MGLRGSGDSARHNPAALNGHDHDGLSQQFKSIKMLFEKNSFRRLRPQLNQCAYKDTLFHGSFKATFLWKFKLKLKHLVCFLIYQAELFGFVLSMDNNNNKSPEVIVLLTKSSVDGLRALCLHVVANKRPGHPNTAA